MVSGGFFEATADQVDRRLDRVLRGMFKDVPLGTIMKGIREGAVRINGGKVPGDTRLSEKDRVTYPWISDNRVQRMKINFDAREKLVTIYRDADVWFVDKPAGLLSQPDKRGGDSLITRIWTELNWDRDDFKPALISRLDRNVSGVSPAALNAPALRALSEAMRGSLIGKKYAAVVAGSAPADGEISTPLIKDSSKNTVRAARSGENGMDALTRFKLLERRGKTSILEVELITGRPHQARVHLASIGFPILGDAKYGAQGGGAARLMLHAHKMTFPNIDELPDGIRGLEAISAIPQIFWTY